ncbi:MAG TPA: hypothetical protein VMU18_01085 [Rhodoblastus sp.]|nr:hypothetical protein [Rhodoblastus sp.]
MCDYSLEMYDSRPAREGEAYVTTRFPSGSIGLTAPDNATTAICLACGSRLLLENLSADLQKAQGVNEMEEVTFIHLDEGLYRDGVAFDNGVRVALCRLGPGVVVSLKDPPRAARADETGRTSTESERVAVFEPAE